MVRWFSLGCVVGALLVLGGCGDSKPPVAKVSGTVELDGKPLDDGDIKLFGEGGAAPETFPVKNGKFEGEAKLGKKRVEIYAYRQGKPAMMTGKPLEGTSDRENYLPARFNSMSKLTAEVAASGLNPSKFEVQEK